MTSHSNGAGQGLVEVVEVEDEFALRRGEQPEVAEVGVPAQLDAQAGARGAREVLRHQERAAPVERERRDEHAAVADRHELRNPAARLALEHLDRVGAQVRRCEDGLRLERGLLADGLAVLGTLGLREADRAATRVPAGGRERDDRRRTDQLGRSLVRRTGRGLLGRAGGRALRGGCLRGRGLGRRLGGCRLGGRGLLRRRGLLRGRRAFRGCALRGCALGGRGADRSGGGLDHSWLRDGRRLGGSGELRCHRLRGRGGRIR